METIELRQYTLRRGQRDVLIDQFETHFIDAQEQAGVHVLGTFRDLDDPDRFVWLRGFETWNARAEALDRFYTGPIWQRERNAANATMVDSDNVLLLRPIDITPLSASAGQAGILEMRIHYMPEELLEEFLPWFERHLRPVLVNCDVPPVATLVSEARSNNYVRLPIRPDRVFLWLAKWPDESSADIFDHQFKQQSGWRDALPERLLPALMQKPERLRLTPTAGSPIF